MSHDYNYNWLGNMFTETNHSFDNFAENYVTTVQPRSLFSGNEKLRSISIFSSVCHGQPAGTVMLQFEILVGELLSVDTATAGTVALGEIAPLDHEVFDHPVEFAPLVPVAGRLLRQFDEVLRGLGHGGAEHTDLHALRLVGAHFDVEPHLSERQYTRVVNK